MHAKLFEHLAAHRGLITTEEAKQAGISRGSLQRFVERQELIRIHRGVFRHAAVPVTLDLRLQAGLLAIGPKSVISHRAALARHGARSFSSQLVEITHRSRSVPVREGMRVHRSRVLDDVDVVDLDGIASTAPGRTLVDTAMVLPAQLVVRYAQAWIADKKLTIDDLSAAIERAGNHPGGRALRARLSALFDEVDSVEEAKLGAILRDAGIGPELHHLVTTAHGDTFELDWAYPDVLIGLEVDGYGIHLRSEGVFDDDRWRRNELEIDGWQILNFTSRHVRRPARVAGQVRRALGRRGRAAA